MLNLQGDFDAQTTVLDSTLECHCQAFGDYEEPHTITFEQQPQTPENITFSIVIGAETILTCSLEPTDDPHVYKIPLSKHLRVNTGIHAIPKYALRNNDILYVCSGINLPDGSAAILTSYCRLNPEPHSSALHVTLNERFFADQGFIQPVACDAN